MSWRDQIRKRTEARIARLCASRGWRVVSVEFASSNVLGPSMFRESAEFWIADRMGKVANIGLGLHHDSRTGGATILGDAGEALQDMDAISFDKALASLWISPSVSKKQIAFNFEQKAA